MDANGDGIGDFEGLSRRLDYLPGLGVTCVWLQPFYPSPNRDNGYDVADYYGVHRSTARSATSSSFMNHAERSACASSSIWSSTTRRSTHRGSSRRAHDPQVALPRLVRLVRRSGRRTTTKGIVFPGEQKTTWTRDPRAGEYYFHRFYDFQPDLNTWQPVRARRDQRIMGFWLQLGVSGFRMDAVPFLIEKKGAGVAHAEGLRAAARDARLPAVAPPATRSCSPRRTCRRTRAWSTSATKATGCR